VRHLVLPGEIDSTSRFLEWFSKNLKGRAILSLMLQYEPAAVKQDTGLPNRKVSKEEIEKIYELLDKFEIEDGFIQEEDNGSAWLPDFNKTNPFAEGSVYVWSWQQGFAGKT
jgi:putative pyruvate formate lyase activating enzyme